jgi:ThiF family
VAVTEKLKIGRVAIVGLGGTGSYVLDFIAKTPVREIHLFDRDVFLQHNAFRGPGAPSIEQLQAQPVKVQHWADEYGKMHRHIVPHPYDLDAANAHELAGMDFVFLCIDRGTAKPVLIETLENLGIPFIDVGMGIQEVDGSLLGMLRTTTSTPSQREHVHTKHRIPLTDADGEEEYESNVQVAELNALNATIAVIKWKKLLGFYHDLEQEHHSTYTIDGNQMSNADHAHDDDL